jgi:hypothetical protein
VYFIESDQGVYITCYPIGEAKCGTFNSSDGMQTYSLSGSAVDPWLRTIVSLETGQTVYNNLLIQDYSGDLPQRIHIKTPKLQGLVGCVLAYNEIIMCCCCCCCCCCGGGGGSSSSDDGGG